MDRSRAAGRRPAPGLQRALEPFVCGVISRTVDMRGRAVFRYAQSARWALRFVAGTLGMAFAVWVAAEG